MSVDESSKSNKISCTCNMRKINVTDVAQIGNFVSDLVETRKGAVQQLVCKFTLTARKR